MHVFSNFGALKLCEGTSVWVDPDVSEFIYITQTTFSYKYMKIFADDGVPSPIKILGKNLGPAFWY